MKVLVPGLYLLCALGLAGCARSPTSPAGAHTVAAAAPVTPANGVRIPNSEQPVTLTIDNATTTEPGAPIVYTFEIAADAGFASKVVIRDVAQGSDQTSLTLDTLPADRQYFWRVRATAGDTTGVFSRPLSFTIGPDITIDAPSPAAPVSGAIVSTTRPTLTVGNSPRTGPAGTILYRFEIAADAAFANVAASGVVAEGASQSSFTPAADLSYTATYFWRARAVDSVHGIASAFSAVETFRTPLVDPKTYLGASGK
jgi:hypothetical protein